jgi:hypothetical protein
VGAYKVMAKDFHGHLSSLTIMVLPLVRLTAGGSTPNVTLVGDHGFYVTGSGFGNNEWVKVTGTFRLYNGNSATVSKAIQADGAGKLPETYIMTPLGAKQGWTSLQAVGQSSGNKAFAHLYVAYRPLLTVVTPSVRPGAALQVIGSGYVPYSRVNVDVTIPRQGGTNETLSKAVTASSTGSFNTFLGVPNNVQLGSYKVAAIDTVGGFRSLASFAVSLKPIVTLQPASVLPGQALVVIGSSFSSNVTVTIKITFTLSSGGQTTVTTTAQSNSQGAFTTTIVVPRDATGGGTFVVASEPQAHTSTKLNVEQPQATATPTPSNTPTPPQAKHEHHRPALRFDYVSVWYHVVRVGTWDHLRIQGFPHVQLGVWVHVYFPSGQVLAFYQNTNHSGRWDVQFSVPKNARTSSNDTTHVTIQLWHGHNTYKEFTQFRLVY